MSLYKADGLRLYITKDGVARGKDTPWTLDDGSVVQTPPGEPAHVVTVAIAAHTHGGCTHRWWGSQLARRTSFSPKRRMRFLERVRAPLASRTLFKSDFRLSLRGRRPEHPSGEVGPLGTPWGLYAPVVRRSARAPHFVLAEKTNEILREGSGRRWRPEPSPRVTFGCRFVAAALSTPPVRLDRWAPPGGCTHRWWGAQLARRTSFSPKRRMRFLERVWGALGAPNPLQE